MPMAPTIVPDVSLTGTHSSTSHCGLLLSNHCHCRCVESERRLTRRCTRRGAVRWPGASAPRASPAPRRHGSCNSLLPSCIVGRGNCRAASALAWEGAARVSGRSVRLTQQTPMLFILPLVIAIVATTTVAPSLPPSAKVIFPNQDDQNQYTGSANGCDIPPPLLEPL